jgi:hypothetical protein
MERLPKRTLWDTVVSHIETTEWTITPTTAGPKGGFC